MSNQDKPVRGKRPRREDTDRKPRSAPADDRKKPAASGAAAEEGDGVETGRIAKILARAGVASRRDAERMVADGRIRVNGKLLDTPAVVVSTSDRIEVDGEAIAAIERTRLWVYHKPAGLVTTNRDPEGRTTIFEKMPDILPRVVTIGRLDINTEGLLLLSNDGGLARALELPSTGWLRRYRVRAHGEIDQAALDRLQDGIAVDGVLYGAIEATLDRQQGRNVWITMGLREGKNREIKNVLGALGLEVNRLIRISYGPFQLGDLPEGDVVEIRSKTLRDQLGSKLIEEAGLNFDAPIVDRTPKKPTEAEVEKARKPEREWISASERRERARDRLDTKPGNFGDKPRKFGDKPGKFGDKPARGERGKPDDRSEKRPAAVRRNRATNVWMAPGARPVSDKNKDSSEGAERPARERPAARSEGRGKPATAKPGFGKPARPGGDKPRAARFDGDKPRTSRADGPKTAEGRPPRKDGGFGKSSAGGKPAGKPAPGGKGKPRGERTDRGPDRGPKGRGGPGADRRR
jgi:23S rRNA pseudouridine2605 synthase